MVKKLLLMLMLKMMLSDYLKTQFKDTVAVSQEDIFFHCGVDASKERETLGVRNIIKDKLKLFYNEACPTHYKTRRAVDIICTYLKDETIS